MCQQRSAELLWICVTFVLSFYGTSYFGHILPNFNKGKKITFPWDFGLVAFRENYNLRDKPNQISGIVVDICCIGYSLISRS